MVDAIGILASLLLMVRQSALAVVECDFARRRGAAATLVGALLVASR